MRDKSGDSRNPDYTEIFERYQPLLFSIADSILGGETEAGEVVEEAREVWLRIPEHDPARARASLVTSVATLAIQRLYSAEPQIKKLAAFCPRALQGSRSCSATPDAAERSISKLALMALDGLAPEERSAFLLRKIFKRHYSEIGRVIDKDDFECKEIVRKARKYINRNRSAIDLLKLS